MAEQTTQEAADAAHVLALDEGDARSDAVIAQILTMFQVLQSQNTLAHEKDREVVSGMLKELYALSAKTDRFLAAFPDGDSKAHCEYHEMVIATIRDKREFWKKLRYDIVRWGIAGLLVWAAYALWKAFLLGPK